MGNISSSGGGSRRRRHGSQRRSHPPPVPSSPPAAEIPPNRYVFAAAAPNPNLHQHHQYRGHYLPPQAAMPVPLPGLNEVQDHHHHSYNPLAAGGGGSYPHGQVMPPPLPYVEHQMAVTIRNDVYLKKETLRLEPDEENPGWFLVSFTFNATVAGRITVVFFAKEDEECNLTATKEEILPPVTVNFEQGIGQKFRQPSGTGIDFSAFEESELLKKSEMDICPLAVKAEGISVDNPNGSGSMNSQITQAVFEKHKGDFKSRVVKQILLVNGMRYELQEIYGIGNTVEDDNDANNDSSDPGKECVICLSEPRDTTVLPCRHMCMCSGCAKVLRFQTNRCPVCRQPVERLLEIKANSNNGGNE